MLDSPSPKILSLAALLRRLANHWSTPGAGRVAIFSPFVGLIAGLGAAAYLKLLNLMFYYVFGGLPHAISFPYPWWLVMQVPTIC